MNPATIVLIGQLVPIAAGWTEAAVNALIKAISNVSDVSIEEIKSVFVPLHNHASLTDLEKEAGVTPNPDGSVGKPPKP